MKENVEKKCERKQLFEKKQARLAKLEGIKLKGDSEQRRLGWGTSENKSACFECGNADRSKDQCPIWVKKRKKRDGERPATNTIEEGQKVRKVKGIGPFCFYGNRRNGPTK